MLIVHVHVHVKSERVEDFKQATIANAASSVKEPGVARFDVVQDTDDPARFVLVEVYRNADAPARHPLMCHAQA
jgi:quinol monooxygenase YgiN